MGKGDFGKTPSVWRPSELGGEVAPGLIGGDPWSSGIVTTTQFTEYSYPPAAALIPIPQPWHLFYQNDAGNLVTRSGSFPGGTAIWAYPTQIDFFAYPSLLIATWFNFAWTIATNTPTFQFQVRNSAGTWLNLQGTAAISLSGLSSPRDILVIFRVDVGPLGLMSSQLSGATSAQVEGGGRSGGTLGTSVDVGKATNTFDFATDDLFADGEDALGGWVQNTTRPAIQEARLALAQPDAGSVSIMHRSEMWGTNAKGAFHGIADQSGRYPIGGGTAL